MRAVMIMFDTLTRDFLPNFGNDWVHAPNFKRLQNKTVTFDNFYGGSMPCMPARRELQTGRYNFLHRSWGPLESFDNSVFERLQESGVYCHLVTDHSHYFEDGGATYHNRYSTWEGFRGQEGDRWIPRNQALENNNKNSLNKTGLSVTQHYANRTKQINEEDMSSVKTINAGLDFLEHHRDLDNWFLQIECFDPHEPFYVPEKYRKMYDCIDVDNVPYWPAYQYNENISEEDLTNMRKEYAALLSMCDFHLGRILDYLDEHNMWKDTLVIVNTDHGFLLGEHHWLGKNIAPMYDEIIHVPFFMHVPQLEENNGQVIHSVAQTIDIPSTLLDYFKVEDNYERDGKSLIPLVGTAEQNHDTIIFGTNGGHVCIYDGRYIYMRASANKDNKPLTNQTLAVTMMRGFFNKKSLENIRLIEGNRFSDNMPILEIELDNYIDSYSLGNLLFDMTNDPGQLHSINDIEMENKMIQKLKDKLIYLEAPKSLFERLNL
ncbi:MULTISPECIES: sulfatase [unclassified Virgibacillus]|uniref:sulfatase n=1 Tax=unclassified Virgibacillus TaxID=2620237 RepID=UPI00090B3960|nr:MULTISPECIES: sulfatase [unclassified Virgibacillus]API91492.1 sulfatase [Virgibacillus sp. 6R]MBS7427000.1 sulfatase [Virgibacillus sp. 19R1-5]